MSINKENFEPILWGAAGGAVMLAVVGFMWGGWVTGGTAQQLAERATEKAVRDRLAPICVAQFNRDLEKDQKLKEMKKMETYNRGDYVKKQGWSTMPGEKDSHYAVSEKCADLLSKIST